jgi:hypothetical protein
VKKDLVAKRVIAAILIFMITGAVVIVWWEYSPSHTAVIW